MKWDYDMLKWARLSKPVNMIKNSIKISINRCLTKNESEEAHCKFTGAIKKNQNTLKL